MLALNKEMQTHICIFLNFCHIEEVISLTESGQASRVS